MATQDAASSPLVTKREAAAFCRVSLRTFEREVQGQVPAVRIGSRVLFDREDLRRWLDELKGLRSTGIRAAVSTTSASPTMAAASMSPRASEIVARLAERQRRCTPTSSLDDGQLDGRLSLPAPERRSSR